MGGGLGAGTAPGLPSTTSGPYHPRARQAWSLAADEGGALWLPPSGSSTYPNENEGPTRPPTPGQKAKGDRAALCRPNGSAVSGGTRNGPGTAKETGLASARTDSRFQPASLVAHRPPGGNGRRRTTHLSDVPDALGSGRCLQIHQTESGLGGGPSAQPR